VALKRCEPLEALPEGTTGEAGRKIDALDLAVLDAIRELAGDDGQEELNEVIEDYLTQTARRLAELEAGLERGDADTVRRLAHMIKGSSATIGASSLAKLCAEIETGSYVTASAEANRARLEEEFAAVRSGLQALGLTP